MSLTGFHDVEPTERVFRTDDDTVDNVFVSGSAISFCSVRRRKLDTGMTRDDFSEVAETLTSKVGIRILFSTMHAHEQTSVQVIFHLCRSLL